MTQTSLEKLLEEVGKLPFVNEGDYIEMACPQSRKHLMALPQINYAVSEIASLRKLSPVFVMVNRLLPRSETPEHQDWLDPTPLQRFHPLLERWHLPLQTNPACFFHTRHEQPIHFPLGTWTGPVPYWKHHWVSNKGSEVRIHLVVDLDTFEPIGEYEP